MTLLLSKLMVYPGYTRFLRVFGSKNFAQDEAYSGCDVFIANDEKGDLQVIGMTIHSQGLPTSTSTKTYFL